jgi:hypothetical protein
MINAIASQHDEIAREDPLSIESAESRLMSHMVHALAQAVAHFPQGAVKALPAPAASQDPVVKRAPRRRRKRVGSGENAAIRYNGTVVDVGDQRHQQTGYPLAYVNYRNNPQQSNQPFRQPYNGGQRPSMKPVSDFCWFHDRFGIRALKCVKPCAFIYPSGITPQYSLQANNNQCASENRLN